MIIIAQIAKRRRALASDIQTGEKNPQTSAKFLQCSERAAQKKDRQSKIFCPLQQQPHQLRAANTRLFWPSLLSHDPGHGRTIGRAQIGVAKRLRRSASRSACANAGSRRAVTSEWTLHAQMVRDASVPEALAQQRMRDNTCS